MILVFLYFLSIILMFLSLLLMFWHPLLGLVFPAVLVAGWLLMVVVGWFLETAERLTKVVKRWLRIT